MGAMLKPGANGLRAQLWGLRHGIVPPALPPPSVVSLPAQPEWPAGFAAAMGWLDVGPALLRLDIAEKLGQELAWAGRDRPVPVPDGLPGRLGLKPEMLPAVLRRLGFRLFPAAPLAEGQFGPPAPPMLAPLRRKAEPVADAPTPVREGPFAALALLRRP